MNLSLSVLEPHLYLAILSFFKTAVQFELQIKVGAKKKEQRRRGETVLAVHCARAHGRSNKTVVVSDAYASSSNFSHSFTLLVARSSLPLLPSR